MKYLLADAASDSILAEFEAPEQVLANMKRIHEEQPGLEVHIAWLDEHHGELVNTQTIVRTRALSEQEGFAIFGR